MLVNNHTRSVSLQYLAIKFHNIFMTIFGKKEDVNVYCHWYKSHSFIKNVITSESKYDIGIIDLFHMTSIPMSTVVDHMDVDMKHSCKN